MWYRVHDIYRIHLMLIGPPSVGPTVESLPTKIKEKRKKKITHNFLFCTDTTENQDRHM